MALFRRTEETPLEQVKAHDFGITGIDTVNGRRILLRLGNGFRGGEALARRGGGDVAYVVLDDAIVRESQAGGDPANLHVCLKLHRLFGFDDEVVYAHLLDERHDFLSGTGTDREHGDDRGYAENHTQHGEQ